MADVEGGVRRLVRDYGRVEARAMVIPELRNLVDIAAEVLSADDQCIGINYTGFCLTALPHKRLPDHHVWEKLGHNVRLVVEPGSLRSIALITNFGDIEFLNPDNLETVSRLLSRKRDAHVSEAVMVSSVAEAQSNPAKPNIGVPYGARARIILFYLQTQAIRTGSPEVELGRPMRKWLDRLGLSWGGETGRALKEQVQRISACSLKFLWKGQDAQEWNSGRFVSSGIRFHTTCQQGHRRQDRFWEDCIVLDEAFYNALCQNPVMLQEAALRGLADRSASLDVYVWLAHRLHNLDKPTPIRWAALRNQFGSHYATARNFRRDFRNMLAPAVSAYPEARVEFAEDDSGLVLYPSRPPVAPRFVAGTRIPVSTS